MPIALRNAATTSDRRALLRPGRKAMRVLLLSPLVAASASGAALLHPGGTAALPLVRPNSNVERAGVLRDGVLTVTLEAKESLWHFNGANRHRPMTIAAFAEPGKAPLMPAPLLRAPVGTELRLSIHNSLGQPLTFFVPASIHGGPARAMDSIVVTPGALEMLTTRATVAGNYVYRATTPNRASQEGSSLLAGAVVIDTSATPARDHVFVIMMTLDSALAACADSNQAPDPLTGCRVIFGHLRFTINGRSWPNTERVHATVGDSLHWRVINASNIVHPMHLHGFYYRVDAFSGPLVAPDERPLDGQMVVTQLMTPFSGMSMTWSPDRPGNWIFHCHIALHNQPDSAEAAPDDPYLRDMSGLVIGTVVTARPGALAAADPPAARRLRLIAERPGAAPNGKITIEPSDTLRGILGKPDDVPSMHFVLEENGQRVEGSKDFSPELDLVRGETVAITVVNRVGRPISVHWHGIEVQDSYVDGVAGFSGEGTHLTPAIAPGDSFVAQFAPPRAGTFMYHAHVDEAREDLGGLEGALIVRDRGARPSPDDHIFFLKGIRSSHAHPLEIDGRADPDTIVLHAGQAARFRFLNLSEFNLAPTAFLTARPDSEATMARDTMLVRWTPVAKDGFDIPAVAQVPKPARQRFAIGETYDFEYTPTDPGTLRLEVRTSGPTHELLIQVPIRVD